MTPAARIQSVLEILERIEKSPIPMDLTIGDYMRNRRYIGSKDRSAIVEKTYDIMRHHARIHWVLGELGVGSPSPRLRLLTSLVMNEGLDKTVLLCDGSRHAPAPVAQEEREILERLPRDFSAAPVEVLCECPPIYAPSLLAYFGHDFADELSAMIPPAQLNLRVNLAIGDVDKAASLLAEDNVATVRNRYSPWGLKVEGKAFLSLTRAFKKGLIEIQDEGSQLIALCCGARAGQQVLDYCAGAGGKTLALASAMLGDDMRPKGRIVAMDLEPARLAKAKDRCRRARISDIVELRPLSDEKNRKWLRRQKESFDCVLVDVPCSGTGTWRRNPDMRWRTYGPGIEELTAIQAEILEKVAGAVKQGGRLVYATCSLLPEENEDQIERFLARHTEFTLKNLESIWPETLEVPCDRSYLRLTPRRHQSDGFFAAVMERSHSVSGV